MFNNFDNNHNDYNEFTYYPDNQNDRHKSGKVAVVLIIMMTIVAIITVGTVAVSLSNDRGTQNDNSNSGNISPNISANTNVNEQTQTTVNNRTNIPTLTQLSTPEDALSIPEIVKKVSPSVVGISCNTYQGTVTGTGFIISEDGYIITNAHVVEDGTDVKVLLSKDLNSEQFDAEVVGCDTQTDIAVLKIEKSGLPAVELGTSSELLVGECAVVIGNPLGFELSGSVTAGIISALDRELTIEDREMTLIQTDASINSGNSGGPLINAYGQVVGITSAKINTVYGEGLGFAIPIDGAMPIVEDLIQYGYVKGRPVLGISGSDITEIYSKYYDIPQGFMVKIVNEGSAAEKAGIKVGDIVIGINGKLITSIEEFNDEKSNFKAGDTISVSVYRDGEIIDLDVTLGEQTN